MSKIFEKKKKEIKSWMEPHKKTLDRGEQLLRDFTAGPATAVVCPHDSCRDCSGVLLLITSRRLRFRPAVHTTRR